ncbi:phage tail protein [Myxococcota bacterium]|nr:phage tail protein [Myxococcota bacterium]
MPSWIGRGKGRTAGQPSVEGGGGVGAGGGRSAGQPSISTEGGVGHGQGRSASQPSIEGGGGAGAGGGRSGGQPTISSPSSWSGMGKGRAGGQPSVADGSLMGTRSANSTGAMTSGGDSHVADPEGNYIFALEIDGIEVAQFQECSGLKSSTTIFELEEGGMNHRVHKLPGQSRWENVVLRYGVTNDVSLMSWRGEILSDEFGEGARRNGSIVVKNNQMETVRRYNFVDAWPVSWEGPNFSAAGAELAIESIELAHHGIFVS